MPATQPPRKITLTLKADGSLAGAAYIPPSVGAALPEPTNAPGERRDLTPEEVVWSADSRVSLDGITKLDGKFLPGGIGGVGDSGGCGDGGC